MSALRIAAKAARTDRDVWDDVVAKAAARMEGLTAKFAAKDITEAEYVLDMRRLVKSLHMGGLAVGSGGIERVTAKDLRRLGPLLRDEYKYLARKVGRIQADPDALDAELLTVGQYANRARGTYENAAVAASGHKEVRRLIHSNESCTAGDGRPGCEEQAARGWHSAATFVPIHSCRCGSACRCTVETRAAG